MHTWTVCSQTDERNQYTVQNLKEECSETNCTPSCTAKECVYLCRHIFQCTCYDYKNGHLCKHVHAVKALHTPQEAVEIDDITQPLITMTTKPPMEEKPTGE